MNVTIKIEHINDGSGECYNGGEKFAEESVLLQQMGVTDEIRNMEGIEFLEKLQQKERIVYKIHKKNAVLKRVYSIFSVDFFVGKNMLFFYIPGEKLLVNYLSICYHN